MNIAGYFIGIMTGTSVDAIDCALLTINQNGKPNFIAATEVVISDSLRTEILDLTHSQHTDLEAIAHLDITLARQYAQAVKQLLLATDRQAKDIIAIGSHGQTIRHRPNAKPGFSIQLGNGDELVQLTGINCITCFRQRDIALGGQGAPLAPLFHHRLFHQAGKTVVAINLGGIANVSILHPDGRIEGFDTGPANTLMDQWIYRHRQQRYDKEAAWAQCGQLNPPLLDRLMSEPYLHASPPKSTGVELFNLSWLEQYIGNDPIAPEDVQRTLCEFTALTISQAILGQCQTVDTVVLCGGGSNNPLLVNRLGNHLAQCTIQHADDYGIPAQWIEAAMFAWFAWRTMNGLPSNLPAVTGASDQTILGCIHRIV